MQPSKHLRPARLTLAACAAAAVCWAGAACGPPELTCVEVDPTCAPLYEPTFENIYANTLVDSCGSGRNACHSEAGAKGGLSLATMTRAYQSLLEAGQERVIPGDPGCSIAVARMASTHDDLQMPPGTPLPVSERCAIERWIANGAPAPASSLPAPREHR